MGTKSSKAKPQDFNEFLCSIQYNRQELEEWYKIFMIDNTSGFLTTKHFSNFYEMFFPDGDPTKFLNKVYPVFQTWEETIDFREFICGISVLCRGKVKDKLRFACYLYDNDGKGKIKKKEIFEIMTAIYKMVDLVSDIDLSAKEKTPKSLERKVESMFQKMNKDKDETFSVDEFVLAAMDDPSFLRVIESNIGDLNKPGASWYPTS